MAKKKTSKFEITAEDLKLVAIQEEKARLMSSIKVNVKAKNEKQKLYWKYLKDVNKQIVIGSGSPGTGKSYLSMAYALKALKEGEYKHIKILIPTCEASSKLSIGLLPGSIDEKIQPFVDNSKYTLAKVLEKSDVLNVSKIVDDLFKGQKISVELISYIRGKTFDDTLVLIEEAENLSPEEIILVITRMGENSKIVISGDPKQADRKYPNGKSGLGMVIEKLSDMEEVGHVHFTDNDVVRNLLITKILKKWYDEAK